MDVEQVENLLSRQAGSSDTDADVIADLILEASDAVQAYIGYEVDQFDPRLARITARIVVRALTDSGSGLPAEATSVSYGAGSYSHSISFGNGGAGGGVWLTAQDKKRLRGYRCSGAFTIKPRTG